MLDNHLTNEEKSGVERNRVLQKDADNSMNGERKHRTRFKENGNKKILTLRIR